MYRSSSIAASLLALSALAFLSGCRPDPDEYERCVDAGNRVVAPSFCLNKEMSPSKATSGSGYHYYYGGEGNREGETAHGGSNSPVYGHSYVSASQSTATGRELYSHPAGPRSGGNHE